MDVCLFFKTLKKPKYTMHNYPVPYQKVANDMFLKQKDRSFNNSDLLNYEKIKNQFEDWLEHDGFNFGNKLLKDIIKKNKNIKIKKQVKTFPEINLYLDNFRFILVWSFNQAATSKSFTKRFIRFFYFMFIRLKR